MPNHLKSGSYCRKKQETLYPERDKNQSRVWVTVDWNRVPKNRLLNALVIIKGAGGQFEIKIRADRPELNGAGNFNGFIENNGYISIFAQHFARKVSKPGSEWIIVDGLGHTGRSLMAAGPGLAKYSKPTDTTAIRQNGSYAAYSFYSSSEVPGKLYVYTLPTHPLNKSFSMRFGINIDDGPVQIVDIKTH